MTALFALKMTHFSEDGSMQPACGSRARIEGFAYKKTGEPLTLPASVPLCDKCCSILGLGLTKVTGNV